VRVFAVVTKTGCLCTTFVATFLTAGGRAVSTVAAYFAAFLTLTMYGLAVLIHARKWAGILTALAPEFGIAAAFALTSDGRAGLVDASVVTSRSAVKTPVG